MAKKKQPQGSDGAALSPEFLRSVGGKKLALGVTGEYGEMWNFGWIPPESRDKDAEAGDDFAKAKLAPRFAITGTPNPAVYEKDKAVLCDLWKHPDVVECNGGEFTGVHQITGSCVGAGGGNMWMTLACVEAVRLNEPELPKVPFWPLPYGRSRLYCGMKTPGEGSLGSCFARAAIEDGVLAFDEKDLPQPTRDDGWVWGRKVELAWSDGDTKQTMDLLPLSRKFLIRTAAQCRSADDVREAIVNGYPCTAASNYAHDGGKVQGEGKDAVLLARRQGSWSHQMSVLAWWLHPKFGEIFWLMNQWGLNAHGKCPSGMPPGGVWITKSDMDWICRDEVYAFSGNNGFPAPVGPLPWIWL